jgi:hypothetical protein
MLPPCRVGGWIVLVAGLAARSSPSPQRSSGRTAR